jgi:hypothetical protein
MFRSDHNAPPFLKLTTSRSPVLPRLRRDLPGLDFCSGECADEMIVMYVVCGGGENIAAIY